jgi:hypothetical protein
VIKFLKGISVGLMPEKRRAKRVKEKVKVTIKLASSDDELAGCNIIHDLTKDISLAGIRIQCKTFIPMNSLLKIELSLMRPDRTVTAFGRVRWIKSLYDDELFEMGIEFVDPSNEVIRILRRHIEDSQI